MLTDTGVKIALLASLVPSVILHEVAHGVVALIFGDDTAKRAGRLTLNPIPHIDPFGTLLLPALLALSPGVGVIGYAKPVPVNLRRLRDPRRHALLVSLAGPATNIALSVVAAVVVNLVPRDTVTSDVAVIFGVVNVVLAAFNLLPIPPLDGSALIERLLPRAWWPAWLRMRRYSMVVLIVVVLLFPTVLGGVFDRAIDLWADLLIV